MNACTRPCSSAQKGNAASTAKPAAMPPLLSTPKNAGHELPKPKRAQTLRGVYEKTQPVLAVAACAAAGFLISGAQIFGTLRPFGIAFAACVNAPYALAAAGCFVEIGRAHV